MLIKVKERRRARFHAIQALYQRQIAGTEFNELKLQYHIDNKKRHVVEWSFFNQLLDGINAQQDIIDKYINENAEHSLESINSVDLVILRLGAYELINNLEIPYQIILNEYVDHAGELGTEDGHKFINAMLSKLNTIIRKD